MAEQMIRPANQSTDLYQVETALHFPNWHTTSGRAAREFADEIWNDFLHMFFPGSSVIRRYATFVEAYGPHNLTRLEVTFDIQPSDLPVHIESPFWLAEQLYAWLDRNSIFMDLIEVPFVSVRYPATTAVFEPTEFERYSYH